MLINSYYDTQQFWFKMFHDALKLLITQLSLFKNNRSNFYLRNLM